MKRSPVFSDPFFVYPTHFDFLIPLHALHMIQHCQQRLNCS